MANAKTIILDGSHDVISNIYELEKLGAGHDGVVFRYNDKALKLLKYDASLRSKRGLMTFEKAESFSEELSLRRITNPIDTFSDTDGVFAGYVMDYLDAVNSRYKKGTVDYKLPIEFTCADLFDSILELALDFECLTDNKILVSDVNRGSYIYTEDFLHLCDMDKYQRYSSGDLARKNNITLNFVVSKMLFFMMQYDNEFSSQERKQLSAWVKNCSNSPEFLSTLLEEVYEKRDESIGEFVNVKVKKILH